jgi:hypothetical protein
MPEEKVQQRLNDINAISIAIDTYDDIFSDFDPRDVLERDLSEDFINELINRHHRHNPLKGKYDIVLVAPKTIEDQVTEKKIISRLNRYFHHRYLRYKKSINDLRKRGALYVLVGMAALISLTFLAYFVKPDRLTLELVGIIFMPLGWFGIWEGFSKIVDIPFKLSSDTALYLRLSKSAYKFEYIGESSKSEVRNPK